LSIFRCIRVKGCPACVTDWRGDFDGIEGYDKGRVKMSHGHDNFMCNISGGWKRVKNVSPSGGLFELLRVHGFLKRCIKGKECFINNQRFKC
jgi:hypothetical protein